MTKPTPHFLLVLAVISAAAYEALRANFETN